jgi:hypothetical protein
MTIIIDIKPEVQAELNRQAAADIPAGSKTLSQGQLDNTLQERAQFSHKIPLLPDEAFSRVSFYHGHQRGQQ